MKQLTEESLLNSLNITKGEDITFLLGAGCSILSGCMAAPKLIYEFKKRIYCAKKGIKLEATSFIDEVRLKENIENEFKDDCINNPYSYYFEKSFPDVYDRNQFIKDNFQSKKPSFGYLCFADYLISKGVKNVLTTNFDLLIERAVRKLDENYDLVNISDNESPLLKGALNIIKLHGDYNYDKIRNTESELKAISIDLANRLLNLKLKKIVILGYSGQDNSVMDFIEEYINKYPD
ncbi:MAG: SIR2 family protein, partial [Ureaplasma sp.]|nr:SIR2 family protein [Ureaplasma sp.]